MLTVRPDQRRARLSIAFNGIASVLLAVFLVRRAIVDDNADLAWNIVYALFWGGLVTYQMVILVRALRVDALLEIGPDGVRINDVGRGWVSLPWPAVGVVEQAGLLRGRVRVWLAPGLTWGTRGAEFPDEKSFAKAKQSGFRINTVTADIRSTEIVEAADRIRRAA